MARTTTKRKSESALPAAKSKLRKTSARRDDSDSIQNEDESSDGLFVRDESVAPRHVKETTVKSRKSEPVVRTTARVADEYEEDEGRMESQQFLALVEFESKKKRKAAKAANEYMNKFTNNVKRDEQVLTNLLDGRGNASTKEDADFLEAFTKAFAVSRPAAPPAAKDVQHNQGAASTSNTIIFASLYERSQKLGEVALEVIEKFEQANEKALKIEATGLMDNNWGEDIKWYEEILGIGHQVGLEKYQCVLTASSPPPTAADDEEAEQLNEFAKVFYQVDEGGPKAGWGRMARKSEKVVKKMVKIFPVEVVV